MIAHSGLIFVYANVREGFGRARESFVQADARARMANCLSFELFITEEISKEPRLIVDVPTPVG